MLILPGIGNSGPEHWQSLWEAEGAHWRRVEQRGWDRPVCAEWVASLEQAVKAAGPETVLVAHSLACLLVPHWAAATGQRIRSAFLAAVPDPDGPAFPAEATGFAPAPRAPLPFPSLVVASSNDPYASAAYARQCAQDWGSRFVDIGAAGHINAASGVGAWAEGRALLQTLLVD